MRPWALLLAGVGACALPAEEFQVELDAAICDWKDRCFDDDQVDPSWDCEGEAAASFDPSALADCSYDEDWARDCVRGAEDMACPGDTGADDPYIGMPYACDRVWRCP